MNSASLIIRNAFLVIDTAPIFPLNQAVFYSGPSHHHYPRDASTHHPPCRIARNQTLAEAFARREHRTLITDTPRGRAYCQAYHSLARRLERAAIPSPQIEKYLLYKWDQLSLEFAKQCHGHIRTSTSGADRHDILRRRELRALITNPMVQSINSLKRKSLLAMLHRDPIRGLDQAARAISLYELKMDWKEASRLCEPKLLESFYVKRHFYLQQKRIDQGAVPLVKLHAFNRQYDTWVAMAEATIRRLHQERQAHVYRLFKAYCSHKGRANQTDQEFDRELTKNFLWMTQSPQKTTRMIGLLTMKLAFLDVKEDPRETTVEKYLKAKEAYAYDRRRLAELHGKPFRSFDPLTHAIERPQLKNTLIKKAMLRKRLTALSFSERQALEVSVEQELQADHRAIRARVLRKRALRLEGSFSQATVTPFPSPPGNINP